MRRWNSSLAMRHTRTVPRFRKRVLGNEVLGLTAVIGGHKEDSTLAVSAVVFKQRADGEDTLAERRCNGELSV